jgi:hypothetical protein
MSQAETFATQWIGVVKQLRNVVLGLAGKCG